MTKNNTTNYAPTQYNVLVGAANNGITSIAPTSVAGLRTVVTSAGSSSNPSFSNAPTVSYTIVRQVFTGSSTYTPTANMKYCIIECIGGGGGGGSSTATQGANAMCAGGGGGGAAYSRGVYSAATIGVSQTATIGAGGAAVSDGGTTSIGAVITAAGGKGAATTAGGGNAFAITGGAGGSTGSGGAFLFQGAAGLPSLCIRAVSPSAVPAVQSGRGGSTFYGGGAPAILTVSTSAFQSNGNVGTSYGGGGSGGANSFGGTAATGGAGLAGIIIITEFVQ